MTANNHHHDDNVIYGGLTQYAWGVAFTDDELGVRCDDMGNMLISPFFPRADMLDVGTKLATAQERDTWMRTTGVLYYTMYNRSLRENLTTGAALSAVLDRDTSGVNLNEARKWYNSWFGPSGVFVGFIRDRLIKAHLARVVSQAGVDTGHNLLATTEDICKFIESPPMRALFVRDKTAFYTITYKLRCTVGQAQFVGIVEPLVNEFFHHMGVRNVVVKDVGTATGIRKPRLLKLAIGSFDKIALALKKSEAKATGYTFHLTPRVTAQASEEWKGPYEVVAISRDLVPRNHDGLYYIIPNLLHIQSDTSLLNNHLTEVASLISRLELSVQDVVKQLTDIIEANYNSGANLAAEPDESGSDIMQDGAIHDAADEATVSISIAGDDTPQANDVRQGNSNDPLLGQEVLAGVLPPTENNPTDNDPPVGQRGLNNSNKSTEPGAIARTDGDCPSENQDGISHGSEGDAAAGHHVYNQVVHNEGMPPGRGVLPPALPPIPVAIGKSAVADKPAHLGSGFSSSGNAGSGYHGVDAERPGPQQEKARAVYL